MAEDHALIIAGVVILIAVAFTPSISKRIKVPVIVIEIIIGIMIGRSWLRLVPDHGFIDLFTTFGLAYIMFLAGIAVEFRDVMSQKGKTAAITAMSVGVPFVLGYIIAPAVGVNRLLLGTIFCTTSLGLVLPLSRDLKYHRDYSQVLLGSVVFVDIISMFLLAFTLTSLEQDETASFFYSFALIILLFLIPYAVNKWDVPTRLERWIAEESHFETGVRFSFALIAVLAAVSTILGFHAIIGAFIAGLIISEFAPRKSLCESKSLLEKKLESFGYGFFIPLFFIFIGSQTNIPLLFESGDGLRVLALIIAVGMAGKILSVAVAARFSGYDDRESMAMGFFHTARLSLIIAAVEIARTLGYIDETLFSSFIVLALVSAVVGPTAGRAILRTARGWGKEEKVCFDEDDVFAG